MADAITVIILNWNGKKFLPECLEGVRKQTYQGLSVTVVDNASSDGSVEFLRASYPEVRVVINDRNLGFAGGNNAGIRDCNTPYLVILNNDTDLLPECITELKKVMDKDERIGACASRIMLKFEEDRLDAAGISVCADGLALGRGRMEPSGNYQQEEEVFFASDCCTLYRKSMLDEIGHYDEDFFAYADETDLGWRARARRWKCIYVPTAVVNHHHSGSSGSVNPFKVYLVERNRICVAVKNFPVPLLIYGIPYTLRRYFWQGYGALFKKGRAGEFTGEFSSFQLALVLVNAYWGALMLLPRMLAKRRQIRSACDIPDSEYFRLLRDYGITAKDVALRD
ncbi:MAG: glycosyltransferase family 2 protein [Fibrobacterota bacterium]|nr:glycosyltransferase family 2 protein [Fibrobacterota bacterium]